MLNAMLARTLHGCVELVSMQTFSIAAAKCIWNDPMAATVVPAGDVARIEVT